MFAAIELVALLILLKTKSTKVNLYKEIAKHSHERYQKATQELFIAKKKMNATEKAIANDIGHLRHIEDHYFSGLYLYEFDFKPTPQDLRLRKSELIETLIKRMGGGSELMSHILYGHDNMLRQIRSHRS
ncbi:MULTISPECIES: hypothetical protein [Vibrio harveyi group]|uniref:hypothetical protein n=1 Tax=Vibrio harveyi group TaxID=717610 RepID=UPI00110FFB27|nr:hypothetical protein [Vibrio parahaemolyticus]MDG2761602.1 hypothetical protein [Vibrio parahaemolyticus]